MTRVIATAADVGRSCPYCRFPLKEGTAAGAAIRADRCAMRIAERWRRLCGPRMSGGWQGCCKQPRPHRLDRPGSHISRERPFPRRRPQPRCTLATVLPPATPRLSQLPPRHLAPVIRRSSSSPSSSRSWASAQASWWRRARSRAAHKRTPRRHPSRTRPRRCPRAQPRANRQVTGKQSWASSAPIRALFRPQPLRAVEYLYAWHQQARACGRRMHCLAGPKRRTG